MAPLEGPACGRAIFRDSAHSFYCISSSSFTCFLNCVLRHKVGRLMSFLLIDFIDLFMFRPSLPKLEKEFSHRCAEEWKVCSELEKFWVRRFGETYILAHLFNSHRLSVWCPRVLCVSLLLSLCCVTEKGDVSLSMNTSVSLCVNCDL